MKLKLFAVGLISTGVLVMTPGFAAAAGDQQSDPAMQQGQSSGMQEKGKAGGGQEMSSDTIKKVQEALNKEGYNIGSADGKMGSKTKDAVKKFQKDKGMKETGQLDQETLAALGVSSSGAAAGGKESGAASKPDSVESGGAGGKSSDMGSQPGGMSGGEQSGSGAGGQSDTGSMSGGQSSGSKY